MILLLVVFIPLFIVIAIVDILLLICKRFYYNSYQDIVSKRKHFASCKRALLIIAHPDDECMFFAPTILYLTRDKQEFDLHVLCLSSGNYYGRGNVRKHEFKASCSVLNVTSGNVTVVEHTKLPDGPFEWKPAIVSEIILRYIESLSVDTVFTFDQFGISNHLNHRSIFYCVQNLYDRGLLPVDTQVFVLESVPLWRKYLSFFDAYFSFHTSTYFYSLNDAQVLTTRSAMRCYNSQLTWYRRLYMIFSRYVYINTYRRISGRKFSRKCSCTRSGRRCSDFGTANGQTQNGQYMLRKKKIRSKTPS